MGESLDSGIGRTVVAGIEVGFDGIAARRKEEGERRFLRSQARVDILGFRVVRVIDMDGDITFFGHFPIRPLEVSFM